jgi:diguanylate cyclase (GGDEF)-like protein/PAS domain S-box-containing protein
VDVLTSPPEAGPFPILIMTGYGTEQAALEAMRSGALYHIVKSPEAFADMPSTVARVLREWNVLKERRQTEEKWRESESRYRMLVENIPQKIFIKDRHSVYVSCNKNYARDLSITPEESAGKTDYDFFPKEFADKYRADDRRIMETGITEAIEEKYIQDGKEIWVHTVKTPVRNEQGDVVGVLGIFSDITERKKAEEEREKTLQRQQSVSQLLQSLLAPAPLENKLRSITDSIVRIFDADFCRIWLIQPGDLCERDCIHAQVVEGPHICRYRDRCLHLLASSGRYTHIDGKTHRRVPFGCYKIGRVASDEDHKFITNDVQNDPRVHNHKWARELGLVSFAGYQLRVPGEKTIGVLALFAKHPILSSADSMLDGLSSTVALVIRQAVAEETLKESEHKFRTIFDKASDGMFLVDLETRKFLMCNAMCLQMLGYAQEEFLNLEISAIHPMDDLPFIFEQIGKFMKGEEGVRHDVRFRRKDGSFFFSDLSPSLVTLAGRKFILIVYKDITERKKTEEEKRQVTEKLTILVKKLEDRNYQNIIMGEMREMLQACSTMEEAAPIISGLMEKLFPNSEGALFMMSPSRSDLESVARWGDFPKDVDDNVFAPDACWALRRGRTYLVENVSVGALCPHLKHPPSTAYVCLPLIAKSDVLGLLHLRCRQSTQIKSEQNIIFDLKDMAVILSEYLSLSIANIQLNERLARQSVRDSLTGLFNRRFMIESLDREIKRAERNQTQVGIIMADLDHFKQFNDKYGHAAGDKVLTQMGGFFKAGLRGSDVACRYGGEEFVFILPESSAENTLKRADQMREEVKNLEVHYDGELLASITLSMGISTYPDQGSNAEDLLKVADAALYRAKQEGRDRVIIG